MPFSETEIANDYSKRMNNVLHYIDENLDGALTLGNVAKIANFSPFHFHRIFKIATTETLNSYINRKRIEKTASVLLRDKKTSITQLSLQYGFNSNSSFTRAFKKFYGMSPSEFRKSSPSRYSKIRIVESKNRQKEKIFEEYICNINNHKKWIKMNAKIEIKELNTLNLAYISQIGAQDLSGVFNKLLKWARPKGLLEDPNFKMATIYHDSYKITDPSKIRISACVLLNQAIEVNDEIGLTTIKKGKFIVGSFEINVHEFEKSWSGLFIWMNENGYKKSEENPFEIYHNNYNEHPDKKCIVDLYIPIK